MTNKIDSYFQLDTLKKKQLEKFKNLITIWNQKINLVSRKDIENFEVNHILHSISVSKYFNFKDNSDIMDLGTGGGLPGIPLSIIFPNVNFHLIDSIKKKIDVVNSIVEELNLKNVKTSWSNAKDINSKYDFIISRAVASYPKIKKNCFNKIKHESKHKLKNGFILLKGGDIKKEFSETKNYTSYNIFEKINLDYFQTKKIIYVPNPYNHKDS